MTFSSVATLALFLIVAANGAPSASLYKSVDCSNPTNQVILHPHPTSCSHYLQCNHGTPLERPCAAGTEFSPSIGVCVHPWQSDCTAEDSVEEAEDSEEPEAEDPEEPEAENPEAPEAEDQEEPEAKDPEAPEAEDPEDPEAEDPEAPEAEDPEEAEAEDPEAPEAELEEEEEIEETTPQASLEEDENEKKSAPEPESEEADAEQPEAVIPSSEEVEPAEDEAASEELEPEVISPEVTCQSRSDSFFLAEYPADCTAYVICNFGQAVLRSCSGGEYFNPSISTCTVDSSHCA